MRRTWRKVVVEGGTAPQPAGTEEASQQLTPGAAAAPSGSERQVSGAGAGRSGGARTRSQGRVIPVEMMEEGEKGC